MPRGGTFFVSHCEPVSCAWAHVHPLEGYEMLESPISSCGGAEFGGSLATVNFAECPFHALR
jgi:hypothetical protein